MAARTREWGHHHGYIGDLRSNTQGRGQFAMEFARYAGVPRNILEKVKEQVKEREAAKK